ncbi:MAG: hypothetical protein ACRD6B_25320 [Bryobacteraceae bacterium]
MAVRTTIVLPEQMKRRAMARAREQRVSFAEFVRRAVESTLAKPPRGGSGKKTGDRFWDNLEIYNGGPPDAAARHDDYLYPVKL